MWPMVDCGRMWATVPSAANAQHPDRLESLPCTSGVLLPGHLVSLLALQRGLRP
jgi:hypothetical protein